MTRGRQAIAALTALGLVIIVSVQNASPATGAKIGDIAWDESNIGTLRSYNADDVFDFVNQLRADPNYDVISTSHSEDSRAIEGFSWTDLAGDHQYDLVVVFEPVGTSLTNVAVIYRRNSLGKITTEIIDGDGIALGGNKYLGTPKLLQDLNGDGKYELVVPQEWGSTIASASVISPKVYRLENGTYVEASRDFSKFYDEEILPKLDSEIAQIKRNGSSANGLEPPAFAKPVEASLWEKDPARMLALFEMDRDKILRIIGRDPKAGEKQAREWVKSGDHVLIGYAMSVFKDTGDEADLRAAKLAWKHAPLMR